jgi:hypothetical protein
MDATRFDQVARIFAARRLSRRQALAQGGAGLAAAGLAAAGVARHAAAQDAAATPTAASKTQFLFVQSFESGRIAQKADTPDTYTLTLAHGLGQTIFFSDRPERVVGAAPTPQFLKGLGFPDNNPPNAALVLEAGPGDEDIAVLELTNPTYDEATKTATYDAKSLADWQRTLAMGFSEQPADLAQLHPQFGAAHLFIDDCPDQWFDCCIPGDPNCGPGSHWYVGTLGPVGSCWSWGDLCCYPCLNQSQDFWAGQCNQNFGGCINGGGCQAIPNTGCTK